MPTVPLPPPLPEDVLARIRALLDEVRASGLPEPDAMTMATVGADGAPSSRTVLLKALDARGFCFYTNLESRKARDLAAHPVASLTFYWPPLWKQLHASGPVERLTAEENDAYWATRRRAHQLGAWVSRQSREIDDPLRLDEALAEAEERFRDRPIPRPEYWGGFRIRPRSLEFWTGREARLHLRECYEATAEGGWRRFWRFP
jgi:pyridoxamine 5'-phosphate oxidase